MTFCIEKVMEFRRQNAPKGLPKDRFRVPLGLHFHLQNGSKSRWKHAPSFREPFGSQILDFRYLFREFWHGVFFGSIFLHCRCLLRAFWSPCMAMHDHAWPHTAMHGPTRPHMATHAWPHTRPHAATHGHAWPHTLPLMSATLRLDQRGEGD